MDSLTTGRLLTRYNLMTVSTIFLRPQLPDSSSTVSSSIQIWHWWDIPTTIEPVDQNYLRQFMQQFVPRPVPTHYGIAELHADIKHYDPMSSTRKNKHKTYLLSGIPDKHAATVKEYWRSLRASLEAVRSQASLMSECSLWDPNECLEGITQREFYADAVEHIDDIRRVLAHARAQRIRCLEVYKFGRLAMSWSKDLRLHHRSNIDAARNNKITSWSPGTTEEHFKQELAFHRSMYKAHERLFDNTWGGGKLTFMAGICITKTRREHAVSDYILTLLRGIYDQFPHKIVFSMTLRWPVPLPEEILVEYSDHPQASFLYA